MVASSGSLGLLKPHYEITDDRVTITRNVWLPVSLLALIAPGGWCLAHAFGHKHVDGAMFGLGLIGAMVGMFALVMTPWLTPGRITCTREGLAWGGVTYPRHAIRSLRALSTEMRSSRYGRYLSWTIVVALSSHIDSPSNYCLAAARSISSAIAPDFDTRDTWLAASSIV